MGLRIIPWRKWKELLKKLAAKTSLRTNIFSPMGFRLRLERGELT